MKKYMIFACCLIAFVLGATPGPAGNGTAVPKWEYACFLYNQDSLCMWKTPTEIIDSKDIVEFYTKLKIPPPSAKMLEQYPIASRLPYPPSFNMLNYAGRQGWELVTICSEDDSTTGHFIFWFKRPAI